MTGERVTIFERADGRWDWHLFGGNGENMVGTVQGYETEGGAYDGLARVRRALADPDLILARAPLPRAGEGD